MGLYLMSSCPHYSEGVIWLLLPKLNENTNTIAEQKSANLRGDVPSFTELSWKGIQISISANLKRITQL